MELLSPSPPPNTARVPLSPVSPPTPLVSNGDGGCPRPGDVSHQQPRFPGVTVSEEKVYVAVSRSVGKGEGLLSWTFRNFKCKEVVVVHVHRPSTLIPTLLGNMPVKQANEVSVKAHRSEEKENLNKMMNYYANFSRSSKVKSSKLTPENGNVQEGILDLINKYEIRKLVMGTATDNFTKAKRSFNKCHIAKNAPPFCEIWFICKNKYVGTRLANVDYVLGTDLPSRVLPTVQLLSSSLDDLPGDMASFTAENVSRERNHLQSEESLTGNVEDTLGTPQNTASSARVTSSLASSAEERFPSEVSSKDEDDHGLAQSGASNEELSAGARKERVLEKQVARIINVNIGHEIAHKSETTCKEQLESEARILREKELLIKKRDAALEKLRKEKESIALLEEYARELDSRQDMSVSELKLSEASLASLKIERHIVRQQRDDARRQLEWWKCCDPNVPSCSGSTEISHEASDFTEFCLSDLETATCDFSESFKIGGGSFSCVYKGEILDRTVAIKKLHHHYKHGQMDFQHQVYILSKLKHPHLATLIGVCVEAWSLVSEYMPNGNLQDRLFPRTKSTFQWTWKDRIRVATEICSGLLYMHSSKPDQVIHGNLKPEKILFDSDFECKISDFGICSLEPEDTLYSNSFRRYSGFKGQFSYKDPEYQRSGLLTPKSDVYSFGIIVLQLLTGRQPEGLSAAVRQAWLEGKLSSVLDMRAGEWPIPVAVRLAEFGLKCCEMKSIDRPELNELVVRELEQMHILEEKPVPDYFLCPILQEIMHDPQVASDGFTYEGRALRNWLENGRDTSPMTNLKLDHLILTPNHALRSAIQHWLRRSK